MYQDLFPGKRLNKFTKNIYSILSNQSILITGLPFSGITYFFRYIETIYNRSIKDKNTIIISHNILQSTDKLETHLKQKLLSQLNYKDVSINLPLENLMKGLIEKGKSLIIALTRFENLKKHPNIMELLLTLRSIDSSKIRFLIGSNLSAITNPQSYKKAGSLVSATTKFFPTLDLQGINLSINSYKKLYGWSIPKKFSRQILELSGGVIGLVKYISKYIHENKPEKIKVNNLLEYPGIKQKVDEIYDVLAGNKLIKNNKLNPKYHKLLLELGVIDKNKKLKIKLLEPYLKPSKSKKLSELLRMLSPKEIEVFYCFKSKKDEIIETDEISKILWGKDESKKYSLWSIYKAISNLNKKLVKLGYKIKNYRGRGYALEKQEAQG